MPVKIADGVEMLEVTASAMGAQRMIYPALLWDADSAILVDTGYPGQFPNVRKAIERTGIALERIQRVIVTHHDIDHIGGLANVRCEISHPVKVMAHSEEKAFIQGSKTPLKLAQLEANLVELPEERRAVYEILKLGFQNSYVQVDETLTDDQMLPYCGGIEVIHTPGHTLGHISLYLPASRTLIAGDALAVDNGVLRATAAAINYDATLYRTSLAKLAQLDIETVIAYHGGLYRGAAAQRIAELARS